MKLTFRKLIATESTNYRSIRLECLQQFPEYFGSTFEEENAQAELIFEKYIIEENPDHFMTGAFDADNLIGICGFDRQTRNKTMHRGEIVQMYVKAEYANKKVGYNLLIKTITHAFTNSEIDQVTLSFVEGNTSAKKLYENIGFISYGKIERYFKLGNSYSNQCFMILERVGYSFNIDSN